MTLAAPNVADWRWTVDLACLVRIHHKISDHQHQAWYFTWGCALCYGRNLVLRNAKYAFCLLSTEHKRSASTKYHVMLVLDVCSGHELWVQMIVKCEICQPASRLHHQERGDWWVELSTVLHEVSQCPEKVLGVTTISRREIVLLSAKIIINTLVCIIFADISLWKH